MNLKVVQSQKHIPSVKEISDHSIFESIIKAKQVKKIKIINIQNYESKKSQKISLNGAWKRKADMGEFEENPEKVTFNDFNWSDVMVPDNFGLDGELQRHYDAVWYRRKFRVEKGPFYSLIFQGVDYFADVWLNDTYLGRHEGYFAPFQFDITNLIEDKNYLVVKVQDPCESLDPSKNIIKHFKKYIKGTMNYHDSRPGGLPGSLSHKWSSKWGQSLTTGGITQSVILKQTLSIRIDSIFITPINYDLIHIALICVNNKKAEQIKFNFFIKDKQEQLLYSFAISVELEEGANRIDLNISNFILQKWNPISPDQPNSIYYKLLIEAIQNNALSDEETVIFGVRKFEVDPTNWSFKINDKPIFIKAVNYIPIQHFSLANLFFYLKDMDLIQEANLNSIGIHAHIQAKDCYHATDEKGILVFQDFPLQWAYDSSINTNPEFREKACKMAAEMVYLLYNHPSVVYYCCHNEPGYIFVPNREPDPIDDRDNQVLDKMLKETIEAIDRTRFVHLASGIGGDLHVYEGSLGGGSIYSFRKRKSGFVSEFGFWTIADTALKWGDVGWPPDEDELIQWSSRLGFFGSTATFIGHPKYYSSRMEWYKSSQLYGAFLAKYQTEYFRGNKSDPYNGIRWHFYSDYWGFAGGGLVDKDRIKKLPYYWYQRACRPIIMIADLKNTMIAPNTELEIPIIVVNDYNKKIQIKWQYKLIEVRGSQIIVGDPKAAILGATGASCKANHKIVFPLENEEIIQDILEKEGINEIEANSTKKLDILKFKTLNDKNRSYTIELNWEYLDKQESNWSHFLVGDINTKPKPGLHIISN